MDASLVSRAASANAGDDPVFVVTARDPTGDLQADRSSAMSARPRASAGLHDVRDRMSSALTADLQKDIRLIERNLAKGFLSRAAADKLAKDLPDVADKGDWIDIEGQEADGADDDDDGDDDEG